MNCAEGFETFSGSHLKSNNIHNTKSFFLEYDLLFLVEGRT